MPAARGLRHRLAQDLTRQDVHMLGAATPYIVAIGSLLFCGASALTLFNVVEHFDPPDADRTLPAAAPARAVPVRETVTV
jgi:hypothetical protein